MKTENFYVIAVISNPIRFKSRYALYQKFEAEVKAAGAQLLTVECALGDRPHMVTESNNPWHLQLRTWDEIWHKENMINLGLARLPSNWEYVAWIDADVSFIRKDWVLETIHQLQHYMVVQMWETAIDLGPTGSALATHHSFISQYIKGKPYCYGRPGGYYYEQWHPGYAWAARREAIDHLGGMIDTAILGAGDNHMAHALIGMLDGSIAKGLHPNYIKHLTTWQARAERHVRRDVGFVPGTICHSWHGKKVDRKYHDRWKILVNHQYDPDLDLKRDSQGLYQLVDHGTLRSSRFRDDLRRYFRARNEDSIDLE
jgi:hypothetical protein